MPSTPMPKLRVGGVVEPPVDASFEAQREATDPLRGGGGARRERGQQCDEGDASGSHGAALVSPGRARRRNQNERFRLRSPRCVP